MTPVSSYEGARQLLVLCCLRAPEHKLRELWGFGDRQWDVCKNLRKAVETGELQDAKDLEGKIIRSQKMKKIIERRSNPDNWKLLADIKVVIDLDSNSNALEVSNPENETSLNQVENDDWHLIPDSGTIERDACATTNMPPEIEYCHPQPGQPGVIDTRRIYCAPNSRTPSPPNSTHPILPPGLQELDSLGWRRAIQGANNVNSNDSPTYRDKLIWSNQQQVLAPMARHTPYQNHFNNQQQWRQIPAHLPPSIPSEVCTKLEQLPLQKQIIVQEIVEALSLAHQHEQRGH